MTDDVSQSMFLGVTVFLMGGILATVMNCYMNIVPILYGFSDKVDTAISQAYNETLNGYAQGEEITGANAYAAITSGASNVRGVTIVTGEYGFDINNGNAATVWYDDIYTYYFKEYSGSSPEATIYNNWKNRNDNCFKGTWNNSLKMYTGLQSSSSFIIFDNFTPTVFYRTGDYNTYFGSDIDRACSVLKRYAAAKFTFNVVTDSNGYMTILLVNMEAR